jgi:hypothetical protein
MLKRLCDTGHIGGKVSSLKIRYHHLKLARPNGWNGSIKQIAAGSTDFRNAIRLRYPSAS